MIYYVYAIVDPRTNLPFYIGKGKNSRCFDHLNTRARGENKAKDARIDQIRLAGFEPEIKFVQQNLSEEQAYDLEIAEINKWGRRCVREDGLLLNLTAGGEGRTNVVVGDQTRAKLSKASKGRVMSAEHKQKISDALKGKKKPPEHSERMRELHAGKTISAEQRAQISTRHKGKTVSNETKDKIREANIGKVVSDETKAKIRAAWAKRKSNAK